MASLSCGSSAIVTRLLPGTRRGAGRLEAVIQVVFALVLATTFALSTLNRAFGYSLYYGNLHSHTAYSPDVHHGGTPADAFGFARYMAQIDVLAVTDHDSVLEQWQLDDTREQAEAATVPGAFVGIAGVEWTDDYYSVGHLNVLFADSIPPQQTHPSPEQLFLWLNSQPDVIGQLNHVYPANWDSVAHSVVGDSGVALYEMLKGAEAWYEDVYQRALDNGWRVGMTGNQDNHYADWGLGSVLTGIWAESLTTPAIKEALRSMRTYGTMDRDFRLRYTVNDSVWMGGSTPNGRLRFHVEAMDPARWDPIERIDVVTNHGESYRSLVLADTNAVVWEFDTLSDGGVQRYFYVRVIEVDGDTVVSSPIWTTPVPGNEERRGVTTGCRVSMATSSVFAQQLAIRYALPAAANITVDMLDFHGRVVATLVDRRQDSGEYHVAWDVGRAPARQLPSGVYFCRLRADNQVIVKKLLRVN